MSSQPTNRILGPTSQPSLQDVLNANNANLAAGINCVKIGEIEDYDPVLNTASVSIQSQVELTDGQVFDYPLLVDCPVFKLTGGSAFLSMPILPGDSCVVLFNDFDIDNWFYSGDAALPNTNRKHSLADGMVFVGVDNRLNAVPALTGVAELYAGENLLALGNAVISLKSLIDNLIDTLKGLTVLVSGSPYPLTPAAQASLEAEKAAFATLLSQGSSPA